MTFSSSRAALTILALALAPTVAGAQAAPARRATAPAARPPAARPDPAPLAAPLAAPPPGAALPAQPAPRSAAQALPRERWRGDLLLGIEHADGESALKLRADVERDLLPLAPGVVVSVLVSAGLVHSSDDESRTIAGVTTKAEATADRIELVPSLRVRFSPVPRVTLHADSGLGATYTMARGEVTAAGVTVSSSSSAAGGVLRFGVGGSYDASERLRLSAEVLGLNFHYGEAKGRSVTLLAGAGYRF